MQANGQWPSKEEQAKSGHYGMVAEFGHIAPQPPAGPFWVLPSGQLVDQAGNLLNLVVATKES